MSRFVYADNAATTKVSPAVLKEMMPYFGEEYGNPSSLYSKGRTASLAVAGARERIAKVLGAKPNEIFFTSCGSESDNWAIKGAAHANASKGKHIITTVYEHHAVLHTMDALKKEGFEITYLKVDSDGQIKPEELEAAIRPDTILIATMFANNEIGSVLPIKEFAKIAKAHKITFFTDAVQAIGNVPVNVADLGVDMLSLSGHKIHAPKGIGALYLSDRLVQAFRPPYLGGEQERGLRPGTENLPYAMGLAAAAARLAKTMKSRDTAMKALNQRLRDGLKAFPEVEINSPENAVPEVLNFSENCIKSETMLAWLAEAQVYVSSASACGRGQPSHTLAAMGKDPLAIDTAIRVSFCGDNTPEDVDAFLNRFEDGMKSLQRIRK